ncbi:C40 family peptidase [Sphingobacterium endophyticum]|uniref:C40 family peptidase n=1 Tax=Sphingobacterium endophyticum TaxID=2546448 RepID=UPI0012E1A242|nr:NlpC/P60 family protein [Sphingobacterium endophyticum]
MALGICVLSSISVLESPEFSSNRVYELLFGEAFTIIERKKSWTMIQILDSEIQGWIMEGQFDLVEEIIPIDYIIDEVGGYAVAGENKTLQIFHGSPIPENKSIVTSNDNYKILSDLRSTLDGYEEERDREHLENFVASYLNTPFSYKGRTIHGVDNIGLCGLFYRHFGIEIPKDIPSILQLGTTIDFVSEIKGGDLAFFIDDEGTVNHIGIVISDEEVLHVVEKVRIDSIDNEGIFNHDLEQTTHKLRIVKRLI